MRFLKHHGSDSIETAARIVPSDNVSKNGSLSEGGIIDFELIMYGRRARANRGRIRYLLTPGSGRSLREKSTVRMIIIMMNDDLIS